VAANPGRPDSTSVMVFRSERKTASSPQETGGFWEKLTAPRLKTARKFLSGRSVAGHSKRPQQPSLNTSLQG